MDITQVVQSVILRCGHDVQTLAISSPLDGLVLARLMATVASNAAIAAAAEARDDGHTWQEIGEAFGVTRQAAFDRFGGTS